MWCTHCRQDVPALPSSDSGALCCPRCAQEIGADPAKPAQAPAYDGWELDEQLRHIERVLEVQNRTSDRPSGACERDTTRFDFGHAGTPPWQFATPARKSKQCSPKASSGVGTLIATALSLGTMSFVCGGILLGWSLATGRQELWNIGLPVAIAGQIALVVGLALQLDRLWRDNREAITKLGSVDEQLHELKAATTLLGASQGPAGSVFYSHFASGAGSQLLLTDLKGQLDLLALEDRAGRQLDRTRDKYSALGAMLTPAVSVCCFSRSGLLAETEDWQHQRQTNRAHHHTHHANHDWLDQTGGGL